MSEDEVEGPAQVLTGSSTGIRVLFLGYIGAFW